MTVRVRRAFERRPDDELTTLEPALRRDLELTA